MRNAFADELTKISATDPRVIMLSGDIGNRLFDKFREQNPERFFNCGVAEANLIGVGSGMAMCGHVPVAYTITPFITTRCFEQIRVDICYQNVPVIVVAVGAGMAYAGLGPTHHSCEDIAILRALPNMTVLCPGDAHEVRAALRAAVELGGPCYIRMGKKGEPLVHDDVPGDFKIGKALELRSGTDVCLLSTGNTLPAAVEAADRLRDQGHSVRLASFHTVKPLDEAYLQGAFDDCGLVATIEEHSKIGGFGSAVAEWCADNPQPGGRLLRIGTPDKFFHKAGEPEWAREQLGLTGAQIGARVDEAIKSNKEVEVL